MPITSSDLILYVSANHPTNDSGTSGGAVNSLRRAQLTQFVGSANVVLVSDGTDARAVTVTFRNNTGAVVTELLNLNNTTEVPTAATAERLLSVDAGGTDPARTISIKEGAGGAVRATIPPNELGCTICFVTSASEVGAVDRHEKLFWMNRHATLTLNSAEITLTADPSARIKIGLAAAINDTVSIANRKATPGGITFVDDNVVVGVPGGVLAAGDRIGVWVKQSLLASDSPFKSTFTTRCAGVSA